MKLLPLLFLLTSCATVDRERCASALHHCIAIVMATQPEKWQEIEAMGEPQ